MRYQWDEGKNEANKHKHGVGFETAVLVFDDPFEFTEEDLDSRDESRFRTVGFAGAGPLLLVISTERGIIEGEIVLRIISARRALTPERKRYETQRAYRHL